MKVCKKCRISRPETSFDIRLSCKDGRRATCRYCRDVHQGRRVPEMPRFTRPLDSKIYLITAAQNDTPVHEEFWRALNVAAEERGAELVVIPLRYKNPTSVWTQKNREGDRWAPEVGPYLYNTRKKLNDNVMLVGDVKTIPTASSPLTGFESLTGKESCVIGHTKMQLKTVAVPTTRYPKVLTTTGACTVPNYTDSKSGAIGKFHHFLGAIIVEVQSSKVFHVRQLNADKSDGSFIDLDKLYTTKRAETAGPALGLVLGDIHRRWVDPKVEQATFGPDGMLEVLNPQKLFWHDTNDNHVVNPWHQGDPFTAYGKFKAKIGNVREEVEQAIDYVREMGKGRENVIVASNHDDFLARWLKRADWKTDPVNAKFYLETALAVLETVEKTSGGITYQDAFQYWVRKLAPEIHAASLDESVKVADIECGMHGHLGPSGAQGTVKNLSRLGVRVISGHGHGPAIEEGHYRVGKSTGRQEYEHGPDASLQTHCVVYANAKRSLLNIIEGGWKL